MRNLGGDVVGTKYAVIAEKLSLKATPDTKVV